MSDDLDYYVEVVSRDTKAVIRRLGPMREHKADAVERGIQINLDHTTFFTRVTSEPRKEDYGSA